MTKLLPHIAYIVVILVFAACWFADMEIAERKVEESLLIAKRALYKVHDLDQRNQELHQLWQDAQFDRATKLHAIEGFRKILSRHKIQWLEDEKGIVLEIAPPEPNP